MGTADSWHSMHGSCPDTAVMELKGTDLCCVRGGRRVFSGVNFTVESSKSMVLTGANGAGKSSLLRLIAGLIRPEEGAVALERRRRRIERRRAGALCRPSRSPQTGAHGDRKPHLLGALSQRRSPAGTCERGGERPRRRRSRRTRPSAGRLSLRRAAAAAVAGADAGGAAADLAARRAHHRPRRGLPGAPAPGHAGPSRRRRDHPRRHPRAARASTARRNCGSDRRSASP